MNKLDLRPSAILMKAQPKDSRRIRNSTKVLGATFGTLFALGGIVGICLIAFSAIKARISVPKGSVGGVAILPAVKASPAIPVDKANGMVIPQPSTNQAHSAAVAANLSTIDQKSTPTLSPTPASMPALQNERKASVSDREFLESKEPNAEPRNPDRQLSGAVRKNLERERREAERKRTRLEEMYQKHEISSDAYKKGEEDYKSAIEKYRTALNARRETKSESSGSF
jgi:hypothetical protein